METILDKVIKNETLTEVTVIENQTGHTMYGSFNDKESAKNFANYYRRKNSKRIVKYTVTSIAY